MCCTTRTWGEKGRFRRTTGKWRVADLAKSALTNTTEENEVEEVYVSIKVYGLEITEGLSSGDGKVDREVYLWSTTDATHVSLRS